MTHSVDKNTPPLALDGSQGEGGGQILRTALGLSALTGRPFVIERIRAKRDKPGLMRQHLTAVNAAAEICGAVVDGATIGSSRVAFTPGPVRAGEYCFAIGSAGSTTLVLQTVLPALLTASGPSLITLEGGTHNPHAPTVDFIREAFVPIVNRMGPSVEIELERHGFYPAGGGRWQAAITPAKRLTPITIDQRGAILRRTAKAVVAALSGDIAKRELAKVEQRLGWSGDALQIRQLPADQGPGNVVLLTVECEHVTEVFTAIGQKGVSAESVADAAIDDVRAYLASNAPVGECLADQLLIPLAMAGGGSFVATRATQHLTTNAAVVEQFLPVRIRIDTGGGGVQCTIAGE
ncbi:MAG TPA: RNA 3'-terminal phosphate cyclase [Tepidisphaeraceae bacterium]|jgi:RNA 3'-terminal phosphate cyclase (ATP)